MRLSRSQIPRSIGTGYVSVFRGTPSLVQLFLLYFGGPQIGINLSAFTAGWIGLGMNITAYMAESIRGECQRLDGGAGPTPSMPRCRLSQAGKRCPDFSRPGLRTHGPPIAGRSQRYARRSKSCIRRRAWFRLVRFARHEPHVCATRCGLGKARKCSSRASGSFSIL